MEPGNYTELVEKMKLVRGNLSSVADLVVEAQQGPRNSAYIRGTHLANLGYPSFDKEDLYSKAVD